MRYYQSGDGLYEIEWRRWGFETLKYNIDHNIFLYGDYSQISHKAKRCELEWFVWKARECVVRNMFLDLKEKKVNREIRRI